MALMGLRGSDSPGVHLQRSVILLLPSEIG